MKHETETIETIDALVDAFGKTGAFARLLDVVPSAVSNWKAEGAIPRGYHLQIYLEARRRRLRLSPKVFNMTDKYFVSQPEAHAD
jgi:hypothetical protein